MKRYAHRLQSKRGKKYELERASWSTYLNFVEMYDAIEDQLIKAGVATRLPSPQAMDRSGKAVDDSKDAFGYKVTCEITHRHMIFVGDEVGANINYTGDGNRGGEKQVVQRGCEANAGQARANAVAGGSVLRGLAWAYRR